MAVSTVRIHSYIVFSQSCFPWDSHFVGADRAFISIEMAWKSASGEDRNNIREVIPKFYYLSDFLTSSNMFVLGEWWSEWECLTHQLLSTVVLVNTCAMEVSYLANRYLIYTFDKQLKKL